MELNSLLDRASSNHTVCTHQGNADLYGLGIRIGIYLQIITVQVSGLLSYTLGTEDYVGEAAVVFVISVVSVLLREIVRENRNLKAIEVIPILSLLLAQVNAFRGVNTLRIIPSMIHSVEFLGLIGLLVWFWWHGMDQLGRLCTDYNDKAFFFAKVSLWHWFRTFNKVFSVIAAITGVWAAILYIIGFSWIALTHALKIARIVLRRQDDDTDSEPAEKTANFSVADFFLSFGVILFVEMTLKWNPITGVHTLRSPGQFMPFVIALAQLFAVLYKGISKGARAMAMSDLGVEDDGIDSDSDLDCEHPKGLRRRGVYENPGITSREPSSHEDIELTAK